MFVWVGDTVRNPALVLLRQTCVSSTIRKQVQADVRSYSSSMTFDPGLQSRHDPLLHFSDA